MKLLTLLLLCLASALSLSATDTSAPPVLPALKRLLLEKVAKRASELQGDTAKPGDSSRGATAFAFSGSTPVFTAIVNSLTEDAQYRAALSELLTKGREEFEKEAAKEGFPNDVSAALAAFLVQHWTIARGGTTVDDATSSAFARQLRTAMSSPEMKAAKDAEKQALYEWLLGVTFITTASWEQGKTDGDQASLKALQSAAGDAVRSLVGVGVDDFEFSATGFKLLKQPTQVAQSSHTSPAVQNPREAQAAAQQMVGADTILPGSLQNGLPSGLFWRIRFDGTSLVVETLVFMPDGRLASLFRVRADGSLDWPTISKEGYGGAWGMQGGQLVIRRYTESKPETTAMKIVRAQNGELRLSLDGISWTPVAPSPSTLNGHFHMSASRSMTSSGFSAGSGRMTQITTNASFSGDFYFTPDGRYSNRESMAAMSNANLASNGASDWSGTGGGTEGGDGQYQIRGYALALLNKQGTKVLPCIKLSDKQLYIEGSLYVLKN